MKPPLYFCLTNVKALQIITLSSSSSLLFLELSCNHLQGTEENRRKDLINVAIWINFRQEMFLPFLYSTLLSGPQWGNKLSYNVRKGILLSKDTLFCWLFSREVTEWHKFPEEMHSRHNSDVNMAMNCEPLTELSAGTGEEKKKRGRGRGRKRREEILQYKGIRIVWLAKANAFRESCLPWFTYITFRALETFAFWLRIFSGRGGSGDLMISY